MSTNLNLDELLEVVYQEVTRAIAADAFWIALCDRVSREFEFRMRVVQGTREPLTREHITSGLSFSVLTSKQPLLIRNYAREKDQLPALERWDSTKTPDSWLGIPMLHGDDVLGIISVEAYRPDAYGEAEQELLSTIAGVVAVAIQNARLSEMANDERQRLQLLYDVGHELSANLDPIAILDRAVQLSTHALGGSRGEALVFEPSTNRLHVRALAGGSEPSLSDLDAQINLHVGEGLAGWVAAQRRPALVLDAASDPRWLPVPKLDQPFQTVVSAPIVSGSDLLGVLNILSETRGAFGPEHMELLVALSRQVAAALTNARLYDEIRNTKNFLENVMASSIDILSTTDEHGIVTFCNQGAVKIMGMRGEDTVGQPMSKYYVGGREEARRVMRLLRERGELRDYETALWHTDGHPVPISLSASFLKDEQGKTIGVLGVAKNITERKQAELELQQRANEFSALYETMLDLAAQRDVPLLLQAIIDRASSLLHTQSGAIYLYDQARDDLELAVTKGFPSSFVGTRLSLGEGMAGRVAQTHQPLIVDDYHTWEHRSPQYEELALKAVVQVPMLFGGELIGVLEVDELGAASPRAALGATRRFTDADARLLSLFAGQAAAAVHNARLLQQSNAHAQRQEALYRTSTALARLRGVEELCETVVDAGRDVLGYRFLGILLRDPESGDRVMHAQSGWDDAPPRWRLRPGEGLSEQALLTGKLHYWPDVTQAPGFVRGVGGSRAEVDVPIRIGDSVLGVLVAEDPRVDAFDEGDFDVLQAVANQLAIALENARLLDTVQQELAEREITAQTLRLQSTRLQIAIEIGAAVTSQLDIDQVIPRVIELMQKQFGYYHVGIFLIDETGRWAIERPTVRLDPGFKDTVKLEVGGHSLIGHATSAVEACIVQDVSKDPRYLYDPRLPDTRAEAVLPLMSGRSVIGVLDVQSNETDAFTDELVAILATIADQIAIAFHNARLHAAMTARARELEAAYRSLQENQERLLTAEKMASLGRLTAGIAHEMNTPLATVRVALVELSKLVAEYQASIGDAGVTVEDHGQIAREMQSSIQLADTAAERAASFVRGIKTQTRDVAHERQRFNAVSVIHETLLLLGHALRQAACTVRFEPGMTVVELSGSPGRLAQVLTNLVTNAIDASATKGGGVITLELTAGRDRVDLAVRDEGCGIAPEHLSKVFDPMFTTKPFGQGTGLGLTIVHHIVTAELGGTIEVSSEHGKGTTVTLLFPTGLAGTP
ncbi:MAG: GAF domain-containing protein [Acidobacteria bacterium]|nr:GAF domain-containing protein [Acidobacteriota bacterium]